MVQIKNFDTSNFKYLRADSLERSPFVGMFIFTDLIYDCSIILKIYLGGNKRHGYSDNCIFYQYDYAYYNMNYEW